MKKEKDPFKRAILDGLQLAFKVTANSLYGSCGAPTSSLYLKQIGASTTAIGRNMLLFAKNFMENILPQIVYHIFNNDNKEKYNEYMIELLKNIHEDKLKTINEKYQSISNFIEFIHSEIIKYLKDISINPVVIYGDTDSIFTNLNLVDTKTKMKMKNKIGLGISIQMGILSSILISTILPYPMQIEYEKNLWPFILVSKKRYVGNLYEMDVNNYKQKSMGIVLKRRDNAPCVKLFFGGIIHEILNNRSNQGAIDFSRQMLENIFSGKYEIDKFIISKTLNGEYANRSRIAHAVLADRMKLRDPGNAPNINDRIPFCYIETTHTNILQGDRIEHPDYIIKNNLKIDYLFYITNQIMKPCLQILSLICKNPNKIFDDFIYREKNQRQNQKPISFYFSSIKNKKDDSGYIPSKILLIDS